MCKPLASTSASAQFGQRCSCRGLTRGREITLNHDQNSSAYPPPLLTRDFRPTASRRPQAPPPPQSSTLQCGRRNEVRALNGVGYRPRRGCRDLPPPEPAAVVHIFGMDKSHSTPSRKQPAKTRPAYSLTAEVEGLSVHVKLVLLLLESRCTSAKRRCWPSWTWLRKKSGMGRTRLSEALAELRARGLVQIVESGSRRNRSSTLYEVASPVDGICVSFQPFTSPGRLTSATRTSKRRLTSATRTLKGQGVDLKGQQADMGALQSARPYPPRTPPPPTAAPEARPVERVAAGDTETSSNSQPAPDVPAALVRGDEIDGPARGPSCGLEARPRIAARRRSRAREPEILPPAGAEWQPAPVPSVDPVESRTLDVDRILEAERRRAAAGHARKVSRAEPSRRASRPDPGGLRAAAARVPDDEPGTGYEADSRAWLAMMSGRSVRPGATDTDTCWQTEPEGFRCSGCGLEDPGTVCPGCGHGNSLQRPSADFNAGGDP